MHAGASGYAIAGLHAGAWQGANPNAAVSVLIHSSEARRVTRAINMQLPRNAHHLSVAGAKVHGALACTAYVLLLDPVALCAHGQAMPCRRGWYMFVHLDVRGHVCAHICSLASC